MVLDGEPRWLYRPTGLLVGLNSRGSKLACLLGNRARGRLLDAQETRDSTCFWRERQQVRKLVDVLLVVQLTSLDGYAGGACFPRAGGPRVGES
jgi:hypothetical protein